MGVNSWLKQLFASGGKKRRKLARINVSTRFDLLGRLGQGSMSRVFRAYDTRLRGIYA